MKQLFIIIAILMASFVGHTQTKKDTAAKTTTGKGDYTPPAAYNDSTGIMQARDLQELINLMQEYPAKYANPISSWLQARFQLRLSEYMNKHH